jgi:hypothetical protein
MPVSSETGAKMMLKSPPPPNLLASFDGYPQTQRALAALQQCNGIVAARNAAKIIQLIAHEAIQGDFNLTPAEVDLLNRNPLLVEQIQRVVETFVAEQASRQSDG